MKIVRKLDTDDLFSIVRKYFDVPEANIMIDVQHKDDDEDGWDIEITIEENGYEIG